MVNLTQHERAVLIAIALHYMNPNNGAVPRDHSDVCTWAWTEDFAAKANITVAQCKGVLGSLEKKDLIRCSGGPPRDATVSFTEKGYQAFCVAYQNADNPTEE